MDFDAAIAAHTLWKKKLARYLGNVDGSLKPTDIELDCRCPLGQWIHGEGKKFLDFPEYATLKNEHAHFHKVAADVVRRANAGQAVSAELTVGARSEFTKASSAVVWAIMAVKKHASGK